MPKRVVIAGGGTGGHLYPGIALARKLMEHDMEITFIGTERGIESRVLPKEGFPLKTIASAGLVGKRGMSRIVSLVKLPVGVLQAMGYLAGNRPALVVGVGGYVSGPAVFAASLLGIPTLIHEQNAYPGVTNRMLGKLAKRVCISFEEAKQFFPKRKVVLTGNMIRKTFSEASEPQPRDAGEKLNVLILGGSQGASSINKAMTEALQHLDEYKERIQLVHQTGENDLEKVKSEYQKQNWRAEVAPFLFDMEERYQKADLVIARAGATTLSEVTALGKPSILIPFPFATHNHQERNARVLEAADAGVVLLDREVDGKKIAELVIDALENPSRWNVRALASYQLGRRDATHRVATECLELINLKAA
ncbi:MAG: undecaprenyldiphospho-muramoylpentapeptide beta-N-acetylglucosaminyltransferase [Candidatus Nitronauta litoralis]|uniref:UDP-N-acetylglucosamine--N-acetylmuramyl-(pentapeptide) pyrophosphoryl-undecaprenol N-acetylglucosamine transferase n=1 Tax=Candidatus Nitronauta litoralis TaxID=2705533 RepID=A0A7T0BTU5_9BACT|nr:MAG: undecaprenyldiphospho-muramoylpentapeptide beta-N-acetylglucosaminyltransferase [Candidatus Nitronauta litoralis]